MLCAQTHSPRRVAARFTGCRFPHPMMDVAPNRYCLTTHNIRRCMARRKK